jgi:hypothetical protein
MLTKPVSKHSRHSSTTYTHTQFADKIETTYRQQRYKVALTEVQRILKKNGSLDTGALQ